MKGPRILVVLGGLGASPARLGVCGGQKGPQEVGVAVRLLFRKLSLRCPPAAQTELLAPPHRPRPSSMSSAPCTRGCSVSSRSSWPTASPAPSSHPLVSGWGWVLGHPPSERLCSRLPALSQARSAARHRDLAATCHTGCEAGVVSVLLSLMKPSDEVGQSEEQTRIWTGDL